MQSGQAASVGTVAGTIGVVGTSSVLSSDKVQSKPFVKKIKAAGSKFRIDMVSKLKSSGVGKTGGLALGKALGTQVGKAAVAAGKTFGGIAADVVVGGMQIADTAQRNDSSGQKAYKITGDVVGMGMNVALNFAGPIGWAIMAVQMIGALLDTFWDPFKNYFNSDLETMRLGIIDSLKVAYKEAGMNYPIETKPDILSGLSDRDSAEYKEYMDIMDTYLADRGFITSEEVRIEEEYFLALKTIRRQRKLYRTNENGELEMQDPDISATTTLELLDSATNNDLIMMALAAKYAKSQAQLPLNVGNLTDTNKTKYVIGAFLISALFLIFFFLSKFIASI